MSGLPVYRVVKAPIEPFDLTDRNDACWRNAFTGSIDHFFAKGSDHRPRTTFRVTRSDEWLWVQFAVEDQYVRSISRKFQDPVWQDSCVEFFVMPRPDRGYLNFEFGAGGQMVLLYITNPERVDGSFKEFVRVPWELARGVRIGSSLPPVIEPEIEGPVSWTLGARIPLSLIEHYVGLLRPLAGTSWRVNFYKCGDCTSHPHWGAWAPISSEPSFHQPQYFGRLEFI